MRVAYLTPSISRQAGGLKDSVRHEALSLKARGVGVTIHSVEDSDAAAELVDWDPLEVSLSPLRGPGRFSYGPALADQIAGVGPDAVSTHGLWRYMSVVSRRWHAETGKPYIVSPHGMLDPWALQNSGLRKRAAALLFEDKHLRGASCLRALCESEAKAIRDYGLENPIAVIPNGVDLPQPKETPSAPWSRQPGFDSAKVLLSLGRLHPKKNLLALLRAWKRLEANTAAGRSDWRLVIAGWDEVGYATEIQACISSLGLENEVWYAGPLFGTEKEAAYRRASAFILPSLSEGLPMVVLEAWSHSLPVLMTPECNLPSGFATNAALRMGAETESITEALRQLFAMSDVERATMGQRGRQLCAEVFNWSAVGGQTEALLKWVTGNGPEPGFVQR
jgi:poly(glycerol-phosphate) alpha-glucosyltransferase